MSARTLALATVHVLTASGAVCGLLALHYAAAHDWTPAFLWLGTAVFIDAIDGPAARFVQLERALPRFSGARLDLVVDYFTYCAVPAFIVMESGIAGDGFGVLAGAVITLGALYHFADSHSKTEDGYFVGFPALWNVVCLYLFVFASPPAVTWAVILFLTAATFIPVKWVHPVRVRRWRAVTLTVTAVWAAAALYEVTREFPGTLVARIIFACAALYLAGMGLARTFLPAAPPPGE